MKAETYIMTSESFEGCIVFEFTNAVLTKFDASGAKMNETQQMYIAKYLPRELAEVKQFLSHSKTAKFEPMQVDFDIFWNKYDDKLNSSKKKTLTKWQKMTSAEQIKAYKFINKYFSNLPSGTRCKYAETYLNAELWNN